jgi:hypothetical protein
MRPTVEIAFDLTLAGAGELFTLGDTVQGVIGGTAFPLAGDVLTDVTDDVRSVSIKRGRSRELDRFTAGQAQVVVDNRNRDYDPSYKTRQVATGGDTVGTVNVSGVSYLAHEYTTAGTAAFTPGLPLLRGVQVLTDRVNLARNPSFETNTTGWAGGQATLATSTVWSQFGSNSLRIRPSGASSDTSANLQPDSLSGTNVVSILQPGKTYTISAWVHVPTAQSGTLNPRARSIRLFHRVGAGAFSEFGSAAGATTGTTRVSLTRTIPSDVTEVIVRLYNGATNSATNDVHWDGVLIEETSQLRPYFDGGIYDDNTVTATTAWTGTANNSTSTATALQNVGEVTAPFNVNVDTGKVVVRYPLVVSPSPYSLSLKPRKAVAISVAGQPIYSGQVEDIDLQYDLSGDSTTAFKVSDGLTLLTQRTIAPGTATAQKTGARMEAVLTGSEWPAPRRDIDTGVGDLGADVIPENTDLLKYLEQVAASESGAFFIGKDGRLRFRQRTSLQTDIGVKFTDDGTGIPFSNIALEYGTEQLYTEVSVEYVQPGTAVPGTAVASNVSAQADYGFTSFEIKSLLDGDTQAQALADYYLQRYSEPTLRVNALTIDMEALTPAQQSQILALELADAATVVFTPNGIGPALSQSVSIDGIAHDITPGKHTVQLDLSQSLTAFVLGTSVIGDGRLGF